MAHGQLAVEALQRDVRDRASHARVDRLVDPARTEVALDEPGRRAAGHPLEIGDPERLAAREQGRAARDGGSPVGRENARLARPSLRCQPFANASASASRGSSAARRASARSRSRSVGADSIGQVSRASGRRVVCRRTSSGSKSSQTASQNGLASRGEPSSVAASRTSVSSFRGSGAGGVEEVAVAARGVGPLEPGAARSVEVAPRLVVEERRRGRASRQRSPARARSRRPPRSRRVRARVEVEHGDAARLAGGVAAHRRPVERREDVVRVDRRRPPRAAAPARRSPAPAASAARRSRSRGHSSRAGRRGRTRCGASPATTARAASSGSSCAVRSSSIGSGRPVRSFVVSSTVRSPRSTARPRRRPFEEVDVGPRKPAVRRAQEGEELAARAVAPREAEQREQRLPERRRRRASGAPRRRPGRRASRTPSRSTRASARATGRRPRSPPAPFRPRTRSRTVSATSSSVARRPAPSRNRIEPSRGARPRRRRRRGCRSRCASPGGR